MRTVVTGVAGFIGSRLATELLAAGHSVIGVDALNDSYDPALKRSRIESLAAEREFSFIHGDLCELPLTEVLAAAEVVFHLAGQPGVRKSWGTNFGRYVHDNIEATQRLLEAAKSAKNLRRFVYASSSSIYGDATAFPTRETDLPHPISPYGVTKLAGENLVRVYAHEFGVPGVSLRYFTVYGPGQRPDMAFSRFISAALDNREIHVYGDGGQIREFTFVDDVVRANLLVALSDVQSGSVFNVAGGSSTTVNEVLSMLEAIHDAPLTVRRQTVVPGDVSRTGGSFEALSAAVGWHPVISLADGLARQYESALLANRTRTR